VVSPAQIGQIFALYEATRRSHVERVLSEVHKGRAKTAVLRRSVIDGLGDESDEDFRKRITNRGDPVWVNEHDVEAAFQKALDAHQQKLLARSQPRQGSEEVIATTRL
jgi:salicylate hydroxylase